MRTYVLRVLTYHTYVHLYIFVREMSFAFVEGIRRMVSFAKEPYKRDDILQKRPMILKVYVASIAFVEGIIWGGFD